MAHDNQPKTLWSTPRKGESRCGFGIDEWFLSETRDQESGFCLESGSRNLKTASEGSKQVVRASTS